MASSNITHLTGANFIPEMWSNDCLVAVEYALVLTKLVCRDYEGEIADMGDTVHVPHVNNYTAKTKASGVANPVEFEAITHGVTNIIIDTHQYAAFQAEKFALKQAMPGFREKQTRKLGYALGRAADVAVANLFDDVTASIVGAYGVELTDGDYLDAWTKLATAGAVEEAEANSDVYVCLSAEGYAAALRVEKFINRDYGRGGDGVSKAHVGMVYGSETYMSNLLVSPAAGQHACSFFHKMAFCLAMQAKPQVDSDKIIEQIATAVVADQIYGKVVLTRPVETPGSASTTDNFAVLLRTV